MLDSLMLWNEPNNVSHWDNSLDPDWSRYAQMCRWAAEAVRRVRTDLRLVLGGVSPIDPVFLRVMLQDYGLQDCVDVVAVHGFPLDWHRWPPDDWSTQIQGVREVTSLPIWATEVGCSSFAAEELQAYGLRRTRGLLMPLVERIYWYSLFDLPRSKVATTRHKENEGASYYRHYYFGLVGCDGTPRLAARLFRPPMGICQWISYGDYGLVDATADWLQRLGVEHLRTGISWAEWHLPDAEAFFDYMLERLAPFRVMLTLCFTPPSRGLRPDHTSPPVDPGEFAYFCQVVAGRYA